jgi:LuxR family maltose regulon positive regulatory protein
MTWVEADLGQAIALGRRAADLTRLASTELTAPALANLGFLLFLAGDLEGARTLAEEALDLPEIAARPHGLVFARASLSLVLTETGYLAEAETAARQALADAREAGIAEVASGGMARIALASALLAQGALGEAEREAEAGERLRRHPEPEAGHLHAQLVLAAIRARRGQVARASAELDAIRRGLARFTDAGRLPGLADEVERLVAEAHASPAVETPSAAELGVLRLLATDLTQREIGSQLYLSVNTVKTHTRSLYRKLGASSREEAVTRASALGVLDVAESPG